METSKDGVTSLTAGQISAACPSTLLRTHPDVTVYLDVDSAAELENV